MHSPGGEASTGQSGSNGALSAGKCPVYQVNASFHLLLKQKSKSCSRSCVGYQWYLSVSATVLQQQCVSTPATVKSWQIAPYHSAPSPCLNFIAPFLKIGSERVMFRARPRVHHALLPQAEVAYCLPSISS